MQTGVVPRQLVGEGIAGVSMLPSVRIFHKGRLYISPEADPRDNARWMALMACSTKDSTDSVLKMLRGCPRSDDKRLSRRLTQRSQDQHGFDGSAWHDGSGGG